MVKPNWNGYWKWDLYRLNLFRRFRFRFPLRFLIKIFSNPCSADRSTWTRVWAELLLTFNIIARSRAKWCMSLVSCPVVQATELITAKKTMTIVLIETILCLLYFQLFYLFLNFFIKSWDFIVNIWSGECNSGKTLDSTLLSNWLV